MEETVNQSSRRKSNLMNNSWKALLVLVIILAATTTFYAWKYNNAKKDIASLRNPQNAIKPEADELKAKVGALVDLPNEQPTIATVSDVTKLSGQTFFAKAQNGDKVLIFPTAGRAVLYRPSTNKVIEYAPVNIGSSSSTTSH